MLPGHEWPPMEELIVIAVCLVLNGMFAAFEMAFVSVSRPELRRLAASGNKAARRLLSRRENPERTLSIIQIGITLVAALSAAVGGVGAAESIQPWLMFEFGWTERVAEFISVLLVVVPITYLTVVVGELVPKSIALRSPVKIAMQGARVLFIADRALAPAVTALAWSTKQILRVFTRKSKGGPVAEGNEGATIEIEGLPFHHQQAVMNLAYIEGKRIRDGLIPWESVNFIHTNDPMEDVAPLVFASGHTRLPVVDERGQVVGVLHTKEFLALRETGAKQWIGLVRPILKVRRHDSLLATLRMMQAQRSHMAVVLSPRGEPEGIVTMEDITEEIFGDIEDEDEDSRIRRLFAGRVKSKMYRSRD